MEGTGHTKELLLHLVLLSALVSYYKERKEGNGMGGGEKMKSNGDGSQKEGQWLVGDLWEV